MKRNANENFRSNNIPMLKTKKARIECNLCGKSFRPINKYERFCQSCKEEAEDYLLYEDQSVFY
jgi:protein-arginine kinase activator protein McsA